MAGLTPYYTNTIIDLLDDAGKIVDTVQIGEIGALGFRVEGRASCRWWKGILPLVEGRG